MQPTLPQPGPAHARLLRFVGHWSGTEQTAPSPFGPGGTGVGNTRCQPGLGGIALIQDYERQGEIVAFRGHGVMLVEPDTQDVLWWWFDSFGFPPGDPARGRWEGDALLFEKASPMGEARYRYEFAGDDRYRFVIENRFPGQTDFAEFMHGDYSRIE
jgi:hypothetical protein